MKLLTQIQRQADQLHDQTIATRRHLHAHPELSFEEKETAAFVSRRLSELGIAHQRGIGGHGLVGQIEGTKPNAGPTKVVALRADMDALPIQEANQASYASTKPGIMHACGHDVHTASLLGTAEILMQLRDHFSGTVKLLFQPAEERVPGGAALMIRDGALQSPQVDAIFGQHVQPFMDCGRVGLRPGMYMASADEIYLKVIGKGGHAAQPHNFIDPIMITAQMLVGLQQVVSRSDPRVPSILSFGNLQADGATNVIPNEVIVQGTFRTMDEGWRETALKKIEQIAHHTALGLGGSVEVDIRRGYPVLTNDEALTMRTRAAMADYMGEPQIDDLDLWMASEDFSFYTHEVPGCFYRLGTRNEAKGIVHGVHTPQFDIDEAALGHSTGLMAWLALQEMHA